MALKVIQILFQSRSLLSHFFKLLGFFGFLAMLLQSVTPAPWNTIFWFWGFLVLLACLAGIFRQDPAWVESEEYRLKRSQDRQKLAPIRGVTTNHEQSSNEVLQKNIDTIHKILDADDGSGLASGRY